MFVHLRLDITTLTTGATLKIRPLRYNGGMKFDVITIFPEMFGPVFASGIIGQAIKSGLIEIKIHNLRDYSSYKHGQVDDRPFGGGPGMVLMPEPLFNAIDAIKKANEGLDTVVVNMTPSGNLLNQELVESCSKDSTKRHYIIICGRYEGIDQRIIDGYVDLEISIGQYVLSGGEFPAMVFIDSVSRLIPGVIKNESFNDNESFSNPADRSKLDFAQYTRPQEFKGVSIPPILISGHHKNIENWRNKLTDRS